jgi:phosphinothricin acetyltransferase
LPLKVRPVVEADAPAIQALYALHVLNGRATFEETPPSVEEISRRMAAIAARGLPWRVAEEDGQVLAYAYAGPFRERSAYRFTVEDAVYVHPDHPGRGLGRAVLEAVIDACGELGLHRMLALIGGSENAASIGLHRACGFTPVGTFTDVGFKLGQWVDVVMMERPLTHVAAPPG